MSVFEENDSLLETLEEAEAKIEKIQIEGVDTVDDSTKKQLALEIKTVVCRLVDNIAASDGDADYLGGALVLMDLIEVLKRYQDIFDIPGLPEQLGNLEQMWQESK